MLVPGVGILFEAYYYLHGTERDRKIYDACVVERKMLDQHYRDLLLRRFAQAFAAYVASLALTRTRALQNPDVLHLARGRLLWLVQPRIRSQSSLQHGTLVKIFPAPQED